MHNAAKVSDRGKIVTQRQYALPDSPAILFAYVRSVICCEREAIDSIPDVSAVNHSRAVAPSQVNKFNFLEAIHEKTGHGHRRFAQRVFFMACP